MREQVYQALLDYMNEYTESAMKYAPEFKQYGLMMIRFATEEPRIFQTIFMKMEENPTDFDTLFFKESGVNAGYLELLMKQHDLTREEAVALYKQVWIHSIGISFLCALNKCVFTEAELSDMLSQQFQATLLYIKSGRLGEKTERPVKVD